MNKYDHLEIEKKWAQYWAERQIFTPDLAKGQDPFYALFMFPYPSAEGLHIGNFYAFTCVDVMAKFRKLQGREVFEPIGFDAFGIHSENYALKIGETPRKMLNRTMANFRQQLKAAGLGCDWSREVDTTSPEYYRWTQWIFIKLLEKGLAVRKEALLNWCPSCRTVLADEQIENGVCERCKATPSKRKMKQWFFSITRYAERLLAGLEEMDWSDITKHAQRNWIGKSEGATIKFPILNSRFSSNPGYQLEVFTTRPDTLFGATYMVLAPEHELIKNEKLKIKNYQAVREYVQAAEAKPELERLENKEKTGVRLDGVYAVNPANNQPIPVFIADYVLSGYGTGAIMAVPAHDERDYAFAKKYGLPIIEVLEGGNIEKEAFVGDGRHVNSGFLDGFYKAEAIKKTTRWLEEKKLGKGEINYRLRDWCISRQRYWGPPVPVVYCGACGTVPVPAKDLPVRLPELDQGWEPAGDGRGPLAKIEAFMKTRCPACGGAAEREADVMDNFLDSAWYFFRYLSPGDSEAIFDPALGKKWLPVDLYVGGNEHAVLHLMYTRFITMALRDLGLVDFDDPFKRFRANGMILKDGKKMSKSKGNVINPEEYGDKVGYDALKTYLLFLGPLSEDRSFTDEGVQGARRFVEKIARLEDKVLEGHKDSAAVANKLHKTIKTVGDNFESQKYNTAIARLMELSNVLSAADRISTAVWKQFLVLVAPFVPAIAEELWSRAGGRESIFLEGRWPEYDQNLAKDEMIEVAVQINGKIRDRIELAGGASQDEAIKKAKDSAKAKKWLEGKKILKEIYIQGRLVSLVCE